jgi:hypothetical protein
MTLGRMTRCALLVFPLFVCAGRLHAQHGAPPAGLLQEVNRCLSLVRATSRRRQEQERSQKLGRAGALAADHGDGVARADSLSDARRLAPASQRRHQAIVAAYSS